MSTFVNIQKELKLLHRHTTNHHGRYPGSIHHNHQIFPRSVLVAIYRLKVVVASVSKAEAGGLFHNSQDAVVLRTTIDELGFPQGPTPVQTDNTTAAGIANRKVRMRWSKAIDSASFGSKIMLTKRNFSPIGIRDQLTWPITSRSTIRLCIIGQPGLRIF